MKWQRIIYIVGFAFLVNMITNMIVDSLFSKTLQLKKNEVSSSQTSDQTKKTMRVRFKPTVQVGFAGGSKVDRFNPSYRSFLSRNTNMASQVGGARELAKLTLLEASSA